MKRLIIKNYVVILAIVMVLVGCKQHQTKRFDSVFDCDYAAEVAEHIQTEGVALEGDDTELRLFNVPMLDGVTHCVVQYEQDTDKITRIDCYMTFSAENIMTQSESVKDGFLKLIHQNAGEYTFCPLDENKEVTESDFLAGKASMELYISDEGNTWTLSWFIIDENASLRLGKTVGY